MSVTKVKIDGRVLRGNRTCARILQATRELILERGRKPRTNEIAERANCSVRNFFQHFDDVEALFVSILRNEDEAVEMGAAMLRRQGCEPFLLHSLDPELRSYQRKMLLAVARIGLEIVKKEATVPEALPA